MLDLLYCSINSPGLNVEDF